jgi:hypothetical protein
LECFQCFFCKMFFQSIFSFSSLSSVCKCWIAIENSQNQQKHCKLIYIFCIDHGSFLATPNSSSLFHS